MGHSKEKGFCEGGEEMQTEEKKLRWHQVLPDDLMVFRETYWSGGVVSEDRAELENRKRLKRAFGIRKKSRACLSHTSQFDHPEIYLTREGVVVFVSVYDKKDGGTVRKLEEGGFKVTLPIYGCGTVSLYHKFSGTREFKRWLKLSPFGAG